MLLVYNIVVAVVVVMKDKRGNGEGPEFATTTYSTDQARLRYVTYFIKYATKAELKCMWYATSKKGYTKRQ